MGSQWGYDKTYMRAKHEGYRSRAAYKLMEIQKKFAIIRPTDNIVDLGAAPGSWLQVERNLTSARVLGIDLNPIAELAGVESIEGDLNDPEVIALVKEKLPVVNVVLCDAAPNIEGCTTQRGPTIGRGPSVGIKQRQVQQSRIEIGRTGRYPLQHFGSPEHAVGLL